MGYCGLGKQTFYHTKNTILAQITLKEEKSIFYFFTSKCLIMNDKNEQFLKNNNHN